MGLKERKAYILKLVINLIHIYSTYYVPGTIRSILHYLFNFYNKAISRLLPSFYRWGILRYREVHEIAEGNTDRKYSSQEAIPVLEPKLIKENKHVEKATFQK